jgi:hypothetical protein
MEAIVRMLEVHMLQCEGLSFFEIGGLQPDGRHALVFSFLHHSKSKIGVFQISRLHKIERRNKIELSVVL